MISLLSIAALASWSLFYFFVSTFCFVFPIQHIAFGYTS